MSGDEFSVEADSNETALPSNGGKNQSASLVKKFFQLIGMAARSEASIEKAQNRSNVGDLSHFDVLKAELAKERDEQRAAGDPERLSAFDSQLLSPHNIEAPPLSCDDYSPIANKLDSDSEEEHPAAAAEPAIPEAPATTPEPRFAPSAERSTEISSTRVDELIAEPATSYAFESDCQPVSELVNEPPLQPASPGPPAEQAVESSDVAGQQSSSAPGEVAQALDQPAAASALDDALEEFERKRLEIQQALREHEK
jgi:hypothetical protein